MLEGYEKRDIISPIIEFIKQCPFAEDYDIDLNEIHVQNFDEGEIEGSSIEYTGSNLVNSLEDINERSFMTRQANFSLWLLKRDSRNFHRKETADFLFNFEQWIEYCQVNELTPKISIDEYDHEEEVMFASNGAFFNKYGNSDLSLYLIQLHVIYQNRY